MRIADNRLESIRELFIEDLKKIYAEEEIQELFFFAAEEILQKNRAFLRQNLQKGVTESNILRFIDVLKQLKSYKPIQYIFSKAFFYGRDFLVNPQVLIPRRETEELVYWVIEDLQKKSKDTANTLLDACTGSGIIAISLFCEIKKTKLQIDAFDISSAALELALENAKNKEADIYFYKDDLLEPTVIRPHKYDLIVSNPPYVRNSEKKDMHPNVLNFEPEIALFVRDEEACIYYEALAKLGLSHLNNPGNIYVEINESLAEQTAECFLKHGYALEETRFDMQGKARMLKFLLKS